jgi:threonine aldolase
VISHLGGLLDHENLERAPRLLRELTEANCSRKTRRTRTDEKDVDLELIAWRHGALLTRNGRACPLRSRNVSAVDSTPRRSFASDNTAPIAPEILQAILDANAGDANAYGTDPWTARAVARLREHFGEDAEVYFTFNGTGANVAALSSLLQPWESVLAPATAHLQTDECGALERFSGSKVVPIATSDGKLRPSDIERYLRAGHDVHFSQPRALSISQAPEFGGIYEIEELRELCRFAHDRGLIVHLDGARLANAAAALGSDLRTASRGAGVDVLSFGGTKNGLMLGEAICFFNPDLHRGAAPFVQKQSMQLASKMRYIAAQFIALLTDDQWRRYAAHANAMSQRLLERVMAIKGVRVTRPVRCNAIFATLDRDAIDAVQRDFFFYIFDEALPEVRWMTHWATTEHDVDEFADCIKRATA